MKELEKTWNRFHEGSAAAISMDLCAVTFVSQAGRRGVFWWRPGGGQVRGGRAWLPRQTYRLGAAVVGEFVALGGEVDLDPVVAVAGLLVGDDERRRGAAST